MNFLLLDDHITTGSRYNIDLIEEEDDKLNPGMDRSQSTQGDYYDDDIELNKQNLMNNRRLSNISNISRGSQALMNSLVGDIGQNGLRLMSSEVDITGALMLPGSRAFDIANGGNGDQSEFILQDDEQMMMNDDDEMINVQVSCLFCGLRGVCVYCSCVHCRVSWLQPCQESLFHFMNH